MKNRTTRDQKQNKTRAEIVRERRAQKSKSHTQKKAYRASSPAMKVTPVTFRQGSMGTPVVQRTRSNVRKQVSIPLKNRGAELRMPALPIFKPGWRVFSGFLFIALITGLILILNSGMLNVGQLNISGLERLVASDISTVLQITNKPVFLIDPLEIMETLNKEFPELTDIEISIEFPALVNISVKERVPVLEWNYGNLKILIDEEGIIIPSRGEGLNVLTIQSDSGPPRQALSEDISGEDSEEAGSDALLNPADFNGPVDPELIENLLLLSTYLPAGAQISYNEYDGYGWHDSDYDRNVYFGFQLDNLEQKFIVYHRIVDMINSENLDVNVINIGNLHNPYLNLEH